MALPGIELFMAAINESLQAVNVQLQLLHVLHDGISPDVAKQSVVSRSAMLSRCESNGTHASRLGRDDAIDAVFNGNAVVRFGLQLSGKSIT